MSRFDLEKLLAEANADLDATTRARLTEALNAAVEATECEVMLRASEATKAALGGLKKQLSAIEAESLAQATSGAQSVTETYRKALSEFERDNRRAEQDAAGAVKVMTIEADKARAVEKQTREAAQDASRATGLARQTMDHARKEIDTLQAVQRQTGGLLRKAWGFAIAGAALAVFGIIVASWAGAKIGQRSAQKEYAEESARLDQVALDHETRIAELTEQENVALSEAHDMADLRDQIGAELNRLRELREEIGLELVRDDRVIEVRLGDVILRPWRGQVLVIVDEGRRLEAFSGGAALNEITRYDGRMFRTRPGG